MTHDDNDDDAGGDGRRRVLCGRHGAEDVPRVLRLLPTLGQVRIQ